MQEFCRQLQRGIGLLELMLAITVGAVILMVSVSYFQTVTDNQKITQANGMFADIYAASKDYIKAQNSGSISLQALIDAGLLTTFYRKNPWGGSVVVKSNISANSAITQVAIEMYGVPRPQCERLNERLQQSFSQPNSEQAVCNSGNSLTVLYDLY